MMGTKSLAEIRAELRKKFGISKDPLKWLEQKKRRANSSRGRRSQQDVDRLNSLLRELEEAGKKRKAKRKSRAPSTP